MKRRSRAWQAPRPPSPWARTIPGCQPPEVLLEVRTPAGHDSPVVQRVGQNHSVLASPAGAPCPATLAAQGFPSSRPWARAIGDRHPLQALCALRPSAWQDSPVAQPVALRYEGYIQRTCSLKGDH